MKHTLTHRKRQVFKLLLGGGAFKEISGQLCIDYHTARVHALAIYEHFHVSCRRELMALFIDQQKVQDYLARYDDSRRADLLIGKVA